MKIIVSEFVLNENYHYLCRRIGNDLTTPNIRKKMKPSKKLVEKILTENEFSLDIAKELKVSQYAIITRAKRKSKLLLLANSMKVYIEFINSIFILFTYFLNEHCYLFVFFSDLPIFLTNDFH